MLRRIAVEPFESAAMLTLEALAEVVGRGEGERVLVAPDAPLTHLPAVHLTGDQARRIGQGQAVAMVVTPADPVRLYGPDGGFLGLGRADPEGCLHARRLFVPAPRGSGA
jgi:tRNA pseudouridine55 synthase